MSAHALTDTVATIELEPLPLLIDHIVDFHHAFTRSAITRIMETWPKVLDKHGPRHPELTRVAAAFAELAADLGPHMMREERILFPYIRALAARAAVPHPRFGTVRNPVQVMEAEHARVAHLLAEIWDITSGLSVPRDACPTFRDLYAAIAALRDDLITHIHLENDVLFPRALAAESTIGAP